MGGGADCCGVIGRAASAGVDAGDDAGAGVAAACGFADAGAGTGAGVDRITGGGDAGAGMGGGVAVVPATGASGFFPPLAFAAGGGAAVAGAADCCFDIGVFGGGGVEAGPANGLPPPLLLPLPPRAFLPMGGIMHRRRES
jgi:hypothetical protein